MTIVATEQRHHQPPVQARQAPRCDPPYDPGAARRNRPARPRRQPPPTRRTAARSLGPALEAVAPAVAAPAAVGPAAVTPTAVGPAADTPSAVDPAALAPAALASVLPGGATGSGIPRGGGGPNDTPRPTKRRAGTGSPAHKRQTTPPAPAAARARKQTSPPVSTTPASPAPPPGEGKLAVRRFVHSCVEVLNGFRPPTHLRCLVTPTNAAELIAQAVVATRRIDIHHRSKPHLAAQLRRRSPTPVRIGQLNTCEPRPGVVEAAAVLVSPTRTWALALRLEHHGGVWLATVMRLL